MAPWEAALRVCPTVPSLSWLPTRLEAVRGQGVGVIPSGALCKLAQGLEHGRY